MGEQWPPSLLSTLYFRHPCISDLGLHFEHTDGQKNKETTRKTRRYKKNKKVKHISSLIDEMFAHLILEKISFHTLIRTTDVISYEPAMISPQTEPIQTEKRNAYIYIYLYITHLVD